MLIIGMSLLSYSVASVNAQGTAFTYQGRLDQNGVPYSGSAEFQATLWNAPSGGTALASNTPLQVVVSVTNGLLVLPLNFGSNFPGADRWLQLEVRTSIGAFNILSPRQPLTPAPYAITAGNLSGSLPATQLSGTIPPTQLPANVVTNNAVGLTLTGNFTGNGANLTSVNAVTLGGLSHSNFWKLGGNLGANPTNGNFLGTTDNLPLEIKVNGQRALRIEFATNAFGYSPNLVGGFSGNIISNGVVGGFIGGGGFSSYPYISPNRVGADYASVLGGYDNTASGIGSTAMGVSAVASGKYSTAMGSSVVASGNYSTAMGTANHARGNYSAAMGYGANANHDGSFVWSDSQDFDFVSTATNQFRVRANGGMQVVGGTAQPALNYTGARTGGLSTPVGLAENTQASGQSAPALRVVNYGGNAIDGALSVSANGTGYIATFGNAATTVSSLTTSGTWSALAFNPTSDRNAKENFNSIDPGEVLAKVAALSLARWNYKAVPGVEHIGPVAQDFHAAFGLNGDDDKHIATVDADGVALAAIQGLNEKVEVRSRKSEDRSRKLEQKLEQKETEIIELNQRLERLEQLLQKFVKE